MSYKKHVCSTRADLSYFLQIRHTLSYQPRRGERMVIKVVTHSRHNICLFLFCLHSVRTKLNASTRTQPLMRWGTRTQDWNRTEEIRKTIKITIPFLLRSVPTSKSQMFPLSYVLHSKGDETNQIKGLTQTFIKFDKIYIYRCVGWACICESVTGGVIERGMSEWVRMLHILLFVLKMHVPCSAHSPPERRMPNARALTHVSGLRTFLLCRKTQLRDQAIIDHGIVSDSRYVLAYCREAWIAKRCGGHMLSDFLDVQLR